MNPSSKATPLIAVEDDNVEDVRPPSTPTFASPLSLAADLPKKALPLTTADEGSIAASPWKPSTIGKRQAEEPAEEKSAEEPTAEEKLAEKKSAAEAAEEKSALEPTLMDHLDDGTSSNVVEVLSGKEGELSAGEQFDDSDVTEVSVEEVKPRRSTRSNLGKPTKKLSYHACLPSTSYNTLLNDTEADVDLPELDPDIHADPEHRWDIANMTVKEALASWKGKALKAAMDKDIRRLITNGTWELLERTRGVNVMKSWWVLMTKYHVNDIVAREKARLVVKGFTKVCGADYDETYTPVGSYVTLWIFLSIVAVLDVHLMQLDMKNAFLQSKLDRVPYMYQLNYYNDGTGRVCKLLKSLYRLKQSPLLWYLVLDVVLTSADCQKSQVDEALYFKVRADGVACWVLVYVDGLLSASSSCEMLKELKELLEATFDLRKTSPIEKYLRLEIVHDRPAKKLWLHQQSYLLDAEKPTMLHVDNRSAIMVVEGLGLKGNLKQMEQRYAWLQQTVKHRKISL
ncbi:unnamed protein product [Closterium sp. NIES-53]